MDKAVPEATRLPAWLCRSTQPCSKRSGRINCSHGGLRKACQQRSFLCLPSSFVLHLPQPQSPNVHRQCPWLQVEGLESLAGSHPQQIRSDPFAPKGKLQARDASGEHANIAHVRSREEAVVRLQVRVVAQLCLQNLSMDLSKGPGLSDLAARQMPSRWCVTASCRHRSFRLARPAEAGLPVASAAARYSGHHCSGSWDCKALPYL